MKFDLLFKFCIFILEIMLFMVEYFCDCWDVLIVGVMGLYFEVWIGVVNESGILYFVLVWDFKSVYFS